jgi:hypothetical protein
VQVSAHVEQYQVVHIGLPEKSRCLETVGRLYLDAMTLQNSDSHVAGRLVTIDEENFLVSFLMRGSPLTGLAWGNP